jgi:rod shape-determining protein MreC
MLNKPYWIGFAAVLLVALALLNLPEQVSRKARLAIGSLFVPFFGLVGSGQMLAKSASDLTASRQSLLNELETLRRENLELRLQAQQGAEALRENERLRELVGWQRQARWKHKAARVIARDPENWWRTLWIDLGSRDGLRPDLPVLTPEGLVGRTGEVGLSRTQVLLVGDPKCRVAVLVREAGENGVISAVSSSVLDHRLVDLTNLPRHSALRPGQTVQTSGLGGIFPAGIPVGTIVDARSVGFGLYTEARVKMATDTSRLREVLVLMP